MRIRHDAAEMLPQERAAYILFLMMQGGRYSNSEIATLCGLASQSAAWRLMQALSRVTPIRTSDRDGRWEVVRDD